MGQDNVNFLLERDASGKVTTPDAEFRVSATISAVSLFGCGNEIESGDNFCEDGYVRDIQTGEIRRRWFRASYYNPDKRVWAGYGPQNLAEFEARTQRIRQYSDSVGNQCWDIIEKLMKRPGVRPCTKPGEDGFFKQWRMDKYGLTFDWMQTPDYKPHRIDDGEKIFHLHERSMEWARHVGLFEKELESLLVRYCEDKFGKRTDGQPEIANITINGRVYICNLVFGRGGYRYWELLLAPKDNVDAAEENWDGE